MSRPRNVLLGLFLLLAGGCAVHPPAPVAPAEMCRFVRHDLQVEIPGGSDANASLTGDARAEPTLASQLRATLGAGTSLTGDAPAMLFLSGGSLHGAFGAGFLHGLAQRPGGLPEFKVVTGISTGSILATFAFLGDTQKLVEGYSITNESELLTPYIRIRNGRPTLTSLISVLKHGAVASLEPLRGRLREEFTPAVLWQVRQRHMDGRRLYVGVVDVDTGTAVAFDMGEMASRYFPDGQEAAEGAAETPAQARVRDCYVAAVLASSSAPLAAPPVFIDNRMYVDGGARFGMFSDEIGSVIVDEASLVPNAAERTDVYLIVNGTLRIDENCGKARPQGAPEPCPPYGALEGAHADWNLIELAGRSEGILVNQVYRFSAERILERDPSNPPYFARMNPDSDAHVYTMPAGSGLGTGTMNCAAWKEEDKRLLNPVQFYPRYMRCLIDYGSVRGAAGQWDFQPPP